MKARDFSRVIVMNKKLQVFISSTYTDLIGERQAAVEAVLLAKHIPAGMELFSAGDASQWEVIKEWICESDAYLLILGARYGSVESKSGLSYTELEYDFAVAAGMPYFAVVLDDSAITHKRASGCISADDEKSAEQLAAFRKKVLSKASKFVGDNSQIKLCVLQSLHEIEKRSGLVGWVRPDNTESIAPLIKQLSVLSADNTRLRDELTNSQKKAPAVDPAALDETITVTVESKHKGYATWHTKQTQVTWRSLFGCIAIKLLAPTNDDTLNRQVACYLGSFSPDEWNPEVRVLETDWEAIKAQFLRLDFVKIEYGATIAKTGALFWTLTPLGKEIGLVIRSTPAAKEGK